MSRNASTDRLQCPDCPSAPPNAKEATRITVRIRPLAGACLVIALLAAMIIGILLLVARRDLASGIADLRSAQSRGQAVRGGAAPLPTLIAIRGDLRRADSHFSAAARILNPLEPLLAHLGWAPVVGPQLGAAAPAATVALNTNDGLLALVDGLLPAARLYGAHGESASHSLALLLPTVAAARQQFEAAGHAFGLAAAARGAIHLQPRSGYARQVATLDHALPQLRMLSRSLALLPRMMGYPRSRTYLIEYQNPAELRATGGFIGSAGLLEVRRGAVHQDFIGTALDRENLTVETPEPMWLYNHEPSWLLRDSNWSPDFPTTAAVERFFARLDLHRNVDGVIAVTPRAAALVLAAIGPIYLPEYRREVTTANVAALADYYAHWAPSPGPETLASSDTRRKQFIAIVAHHALARLDSLPASAWLRLANAVAGASLRRDLLMHFQNSAAQALLRQGHATGAVDQSPGDYLYIVDTNLSYNKINPWVHLRVSDDVHVRRDRWLLVHLTLHYRDSAPAQLAREGFGPGGGAFGGRRDYADFIRVYVPNGAQLVDQSGWTQAWSGGPAYGRMMFCGYLIVPHGSEATVRLQYVIPPNILIPSGGRRYRLTIQRQPGSAPDRWTVRLHGAGFSTRHWTQATPQTDWRLAATLPAAPLHPIPLPRPVQPIARPGHWLEPHAYFSPPNTVH